MRFLVFWTSVVLCLAGASMLLSGLYLVDRHNGAGWVKHPIINSIAGPICKASNKCPQVEKLTSVRHPIMDEIVNAFLLFQIRSEQSNVTGYALDEQYEPDPKQAHLDRIAAIFQCTDQDMAAVTAYDSLDDLLKLWAENGGPSQHAFEDAKAGNPHAMYNLSFWFLSGESGLEQDDAFKTGLDWAHKAADMGHTKAMNQIGGAYAYGYWGVEPDPDYARPYLKKAIQAGDIIALHTLADLPPADGEDLKAYAIKAIDLELDAATQCYKYAILSLAERIRAGRGFETDLELAARLWAHTYEPN